MKIRVKIENEIYDVEVGDLNARPILATVDGETFEIFPEELIAHPAPGAITAVEDANASATAPSKAVKAQDFPVIPSSVQPADCSPPASASPSGKTVSAPIPGVILSIKVKVGDAVEQGQELCTLEAMKMKNAIRASRSGVIAAIHVATGDTVTHGQPLMDFSS